MLNDEKKQNNRKHIAIGCVTDKGKRESNEDSVWFAVDGSEAICLVADGIGGLKDGEISSSTAVGAAIRYWKKSKGRSDIKQIFVEAHAEIRERVEKTNEKTGTTLSVFHCRENEFSIGHAGDSRIYRITKAPFPKLMLLTQDDTWAAEKVREGAMNAVEAAAHPKRHSLTNCLGGFQECSVFETSGYINPKDIFLLCSDGLYRYFDESELKKIISKRGEAQQTAEELTKIALSRGSDDNISVIVIQFP